MSFNKSTLINFNVHEENLYSCVSSNLTSLFLHLCYTWFVTLCILFVPVALFIHLGQFLWTLFRLYDADDQANAEQLFLIEEEHSTNNRIRQYLLDEVQLISVYVSLAFLFRRMMMSNPSVHWVIISRWMIESSFLPYTLCHVVFLVYVEDWDGSYSIESGCSVTSFFFTFILKGTLFLWMRYTEFYPSSRLNDCQTFIFYYYCGRSNTFHVPNNHLLRGLLPRV